MHFRLPGYTFLSHMLKVVLVFTLKMSRVNALCSACSRVALAFIQGQLPHSKADFSNPTALTQGSRKAVEKNPIHFSGFLDQRT